MRRNVLTLTDVERAMRDVLKAGQLGTPVALRIHVTLPVESADAGMVAGYFASLIEQVANIKAGRIQAQQHSSGRQASLLWTDERGVTVFLTFLFDQPLHKSIRVLLIGQHGISQLVGDSQWQEIFEGDGPALWMQEIRESLQSGTSIAVKSS